MTSDAQRDAQRKATLAGIEARRRRAAERRAAQAGRDRRRAEHREECGCFRCLLGTRPKAVARLLVAVLATGALLAIPVQPADAAAARYLSISEAKRSTRMALEDTLVGFTETRPWMIVRCRKTSRATAQCRVEFKSDRLSGTVRSRVKRNTDDTTLVWLRRLRVTSSTGPATEPPAEPGRAIA